MMQLIHSRKALETDPIAYMELQEFPITLEECLPSKDPTYSTKINYGAAHQAKDQKKPGWKGA
jgi:hypothetical protein